MPQIPERVASLTRYRDDPVAVWTIRATAAAVLAYAVAEALSSQPDPLTAPLTALLVVQVTLYSTLTTGIRRVIAVVAGVLIAVGFSAVVGLSWWSLGLIILAALTVGQFIRVGEFVNEVAISAMLVLGVTQLASQAWERVLETLIGAVVGLLFNSVLAPPVWVDPAADSIVGLARRTRGLLLDIGEELDRPVPVEQAADRLHEARRLDQAVTAVDAALRQAEDSLRLNPRISDGLLARLVLRTGLDTLEICVVVVRVLARSLTDLAKRRAEGEALFPAETAQALAELLADVGAAMVSYAVLVTTQVSGSAEQAEDRLAAELSAAWERREPVAQMLLSSVQQHPYAWQLYGSLLAEIDRMLEEMDLEHRSQRLMAELDRATADRHERVARFAGLKRLVRMGRLSGRES
ncbi:FUSC family protein [Catenulispora sp. NF23]|uniref:FUSC family protein n=1 Tax=Catenulispora pinistramenti TaxID=2705254 RepID=A0ABS5L5P9_9ACTN|nr:aromatic acid exporter family protein [Catenulispora pinistramenti]MBS2537544.1 FUSC family protein [Catenulispora pinistramenti]MBS2553440.1 FUSC family protein [Catenulispora pinistramenti]